MYSELHIWDKELLKDPMMNRISLKEDLEKLRIEPMTYADLVCGLNYCSNKKKFIYGYKGLGDNLVKEVLQAVNTATIPEGWNNTTIIVIQR